jgi:MHS family proline/betaine transporter-like MFS transporter
MDRRIHSRLPFSKENRRSLIASSLVPILWSAGFYLCFVWMAIYMAEPIDPAVPHAFGVNSAALLFSVCILFPIAGHLSDRYGRLFIMTIGGISMMVLSPILIVVVGQGIFGRCILCSIDARYCTILLGKSHVCVARRIF